MPDNQNLANEFIELELYIKQHLEYINVLMDARSDVTKRLQEEKEKIMLTMDQLRQEQEQLKQETHNVATLNENLDVTISTKQNKLAVQRKKFDEWLSNKHSEIQNLKDLQYLSGNILNDDTLNSKDFSEAKFEQSLKEQANNLFPELQRYREINKLLVTGKIRLKNLKKDIKRSEIELQNIKRSQKLDDATLNPRFECEKAWMELMFPVASNLYKKSKIIHSEVNNTKSHIRSTHKISRAINNFINKIIRKFVRKAMIEEHRGKNKLENTEQALNSLEKKLKKDTHVLKDRVDSYRESLQEFAQKIGDDIDAQDLRKERGTFKPQ